MTTTEGNGDKKGNLSTDSKAALGVIFALVFIGCTTYLFMSEIIHTILRMCGIT